MMKMNLQFFAHKKPSAEMQKDKTVMLGGNFMNKETDRLVSGVG